MTSRRPIETAGSSSQRSRYGRFDHGLRSFGHQLKGRGDAYIELTQESLSLDRRPPSTEVLGRIARRLAELPQRLNQHTIGVAALGDPRAHKPAHAQGELSVDLKHRRLWVFAHRKEQLLIGGPKCFLRQTRAGRGLGVSFDPTSLEVGPTAWVLGHGALTSGLHQASFGCIFRDQRRQPGGRCLLRSKSTQPSDHVKFLDHLGAHVLSDDHAANPSGGLSPGAMHRCGGRPSPTRG